MSRMSDLKRLWEELLQELDLLGECRARIQDMWREEVNKPVDLVVLPHHGGIFQGYSVQVFMRIFFTLNQAHRIHHANK